MSKLKMKLGLCSYKCCWNKAKVDIHFVGIDVKRSVCEKHLLEFQKLELIKSINR